MYNSAMGASLALVTAVCWGAVPVALKPLLTTVDPATLVWIRFTVAALGVWIWMVPATHRPSRLYFSWRYILLFGVATVGLAENFVAYNASVGYLSPPAAQIVAQTGPALLIAGSVLVLRESVSWLQKVGFVLLVAGMLFFFNQHLDDFLRLEGDYLYGIIVGVVGSTGWAFYGLINKILLREFTPLEIMRVIYTGSALLIFPLATPRLLLGIDALQLACLLFCCANTLVAYGSFTEALARWDATKVTALTTLSPLFALIISEIGWYLAPSAFPTDRLNMLGICGAFVVVGGAVLIAVGKSRRLAMAASPQK